jgi:hypothetical protein
LPKLNSISISFSSHLTSSPIDSQVLSQRTVTSMSLNWNSLVSCYFCEWMGSNNEFISWYLISWNCSIGNPQIIQMRILCILNDFTTLLYPLIKPNLCLFNSRNDCPFMRFSYLTQCSQILPRVSHLFHHKKVTYKIKRRSLCVFHIVL